MIPQANALGSDSLWYLGKTVTFNWRVSPRQDNLSTRDAFTFE